jgi:hypothetical protein
LINTPNDEKALLTALEKFIPGSAIYEFLHTLTRQKLNNGNFNPADRKEIEEKFKVRSQGAEEIRTRQMLLDYDNQKSDKDRIATLEEFVKTTLNYRPSNFTKPF